MIECWKNRDGKSDYHWSVWLDGSRRHMGERFDQPEAAEAAARVHCEDTYGRPPDRVRQL